MLQALQPAAVQWHAAVRELRGRRALAQRVDEETAGPSTALRSGRDDNFLRTGENCIGLETPLLSSGPERSAVEGSAVLFNRITKLDGCGQILRRAVEQIGG